MSAGPLHLRMTTLALGSALAATVAAMLVPLPLILIGAAGCLVGEVLLSPDLDHPAGCNALRRWSVLRWVWRPYQQVVRHRSPWSHWPVLGTAGRLAYLAVPAFGVGALVYGEAVVPLIALAWEVHWREIVAAVVGVEVSAVLHLIGDVL